MNSVGPMVKRAIDVILSSMVLLILLPVMAIVLVTIRLMMGRPAFLRQVRSGIQGEALRSVQVPHDSEGVKSLRHAAPRCRAAKSVGPVCLADLPR